MIKFEIACANDHRFEVWFQNASAADAQIGAGHVSCPHCGAIEVRKALMAPSVRTSRDRADAPAPAAPPALEQPTPPAAAAPTAGPGAPPSPTPPPEMTTPDARRKFVEGQLRALRAMVEATADHVGSEFATEARRIHSGEAEARPIYGETTPEEAEALEADGVPCAAIPWIDRRDD